MTSMRIAGALALAVLLAPQIASAGGDAGFERMVLCQDSWVDWQKAGDPRLQKLAVHLNEAYTQKPNDPFFTPKVPASILGLRVLQVFPGSVGMGVGFSIVVDAPYDKAKAGLEHALGKPLQKCEASDGMKSCELQIAEQRTVTLMSGDDPKAKSTLVGCYYFYEK